MKKTKFITFSDLKVALRNAGYPGPIKYPKDIQRQINSQQKYSQENVFQIDWQNVISVPQAQAIFKQLTGQELDLKSIKYNYEYIIDNPLVQVTEETFDPEFSEAPDSILPDLTKYLEHWYLSISEAKLEQNPQKNPLLGIVCSGGFLTGESRDGDDPFIFPLQPGINVLIGTRGSGKSTSLNMLSLLLDSSMQRSSNDDISEWFAPIQRSFEDYGNGRIWKFLKEYSVKKYACYFYGRENNKLYVFYADLEKRIYCLLYREQDIWLGSKEERDPVKIFPEMLVLRQGDVLRITDSRNKLVINQILDGLNSKLKDKRQELSRIFDSLIENYKNSKEVFSKLKIDNQSIERFLSNRKKEIEDFKFLFQGQSNKKIRLNKLQIKLWMTLPIELLSAILYLPEFYISYLLNYLENYLREYDKVKWILGKKSLLSLIKSGEGGLWCLYVGLISRFLKQEIQKIQNTIDTTQEPHQPFLTQHTDNIGTAHEDQQKSINEILTCLTEIFLILENRLSIISELCKNLHSCYEWSSELEKDNLNDNLKKICNQSIGFFGNQFELITIQRDYCQKIESELSFLEQQKIRFSKIANANLELAESLKHSEKRYQFLWEEDIQDFTTTFPNQDLEQCLDVLKAYNFPILKLIDILEKIEAAPNYKQIKSDYVDFPVSLELQQGEYREFSKLSYGQKSGIILTIILIMTKAKLIVIDQPEDNLDIGATLNILTPTLLKVSENSSVTIATHNSDLVFGLGNSHQPSSLFVMDTPSQYGGNLYAGKLNSPESTGYILNIIEGGREYWKGKNQSYYTFIQDDFSEDTECRQSVKEFLEKAGATIGWNEPYGKITSITNNLKTYVPISVLVVNNKPTEQDINELVKYSKTLNNKRKSNAGILFYREQPDTLFRLKMTEKRMSEEFILIPIPLTAVEKSLLENSAAGVLKEYTDRYLSHNSDLFDDRNAIGDTLTFFGRTQILNRLVEQLKKKEGVGLFGLRKSGKTSLILQMRSQLQKHPVIHIDLQNFRTTYYGVEIFNYILKNLSKLIDIKIFQPFQPFEKDVPAAEVVSKFSDQVTAIASILQKQDYEMPIICLIDEVEIILPLATDSREKVEEFNAVFGSLRALSQEKRILGLLVADVHPDCNRINHWSQPNVPTNPVFHFFKEEFVFPFSPDETKTMIADIGKLMEREFDEETLVAIHQESGGHPFVSRQLASLLCKQIKSENNKRISYTVSKNYLTKPFTYSSGLKDYIKGSIWNDLKIRNFDAAMSILNLLAANDKLTQKSPLGITGILSSLFSSIGKFFSDHSKNQGLTESIIVKKLSKHGLSESQCLDALLWLESVGLVIRDTLIGQNYYRVGITLLSRWLLMNMKQKEIKQWWIK